ncbi:hypothetical protein MJO28_015392 [Puccinia striiformis f. sp. tritici]|uniref:Uncharacterized protein n=1 Tax=Puccinia striiformis f. sp. tritici TaxID=168172 RepID=A0ACC0DSM1_9BASI|nr:hypothetical protein MJO29_015108 [Puccinia striiformis f. sp. tritici]KAI7938472.1 hypothetical protein MJO28_015392 [Puccinia striiformis f. sp. tritici]
MAICFAPSVRSVETMPRRRHDLSPQHVKCTFMLTEREPRASLTPQGAHCLPHEVIRIQIHASAQPHEICGGRLRSSEAGCRMVDIYYTPRASCRRSFLLLHIGMTEEAIGMIEEAGRTQIREIPSYKSSMEDFR